MRLVIPCEVPSVAKHQRYLARKARLHAAGLTANGKPWNPRPKRSLDEAIIASIDRFWSKVLRTDGCWNWMAGRNRQGYGRFKVGGQTIGAHRVAYRIEHGALPGALVLHRCDNPRCVRPDHLWAGTPADNMNDKVAKGRQARGPDLAAAVAGKYRIRHGSEKPNAKLRECDIPIIRALYTEGVGLPVICAKFGVCKQTALNAATMKTWRHVS